MFISWAGRIIKIESIDVINAVFEYRYPYAGDGKIPDPTGEFLYTLNMLYGEKNSVYYSESFDSREKAEEDRNRFIAKINEIMGVETY